MGKPDKLTPDIVEWLTSDDKVVAKWKELAFRLNLNVYVNKIDQDLSYKRKKLEKQKLKELLEVWKIASPITYTKSRLRDALSKEGLTDMLAWIELIGTENSPRKNEISKLLESSSRATTPRSTVSLSPVPHYHHNSHLSAVNSSSIAEYRSLPSSPYSWYFEQFGEAPASNDVKMRNMETASILKKLPSSRDSSPNYQENNLSIHDIRPASRFSSDSSSTSNGKKKSIRFADDYDFTDAASNSKSDYSLLLETSFDDEISGRGERKGRPSKNSVEKYFDNLISIIEHAAEGL